MSNRAIFGLAALLATGCTDVVSNMDECKMEAMKHFGHLRKVDPESGRHFELSYLEFEYRDLCMEARGFIFDWSKEQKDAESLNLPLESRVFMQNSSRGSPRYWKRDYFRYWRTNE